MRFGPYELTQRLAVGGMAEVFLAVRGGAEGFRREVVVKRILPQYANDPDFQTLFADEARIGGLFHHPNIVQMFDYDRVEGVAYLAMEYVPGHDLGFVLRAGPPLPLEASLHVALQVLEGLGYAHDLTDGGRALGVVHRDISPGNVLLSWGGEVEIADFGVARTEIAAHRTRGGELKGKIPYLSPEQVLGKPVDRRSDLFSLGIVLYQMLTGTRPFDGDSEIQIMNRISAGELVTPTRVAPSVPSVLEPVVLRALAVDPEARFASAQEMASSLRGAAAAVGLAPSSASLRRVLDAFPRDRAAGPPDEAPTSPATAALLMAVRDRTPSGPRAPAPVDEVPTVIDRKSSTPAPPGGALTPGPPIAAPPPRRGARAWLAAGLVGLLAVASVAAWLAQSRTPSSPGRDGGAVAPPPHAETVVVLRMNDQQEAWFLRELLGPALGARGAAVRVVPFGDVDELPATLRAAGPVDLVKVPLPVARALVDAGLVRSLARLANESHLPGGVSSLTAGFDPRAIASCEYPTIVGRELFFLPRKTEVRFLVASKAAVEAARAALALLRPALEDDLRRLTGHGLPAGFVLEEDPEQWDSYDLLALAYAMARAPDAQGRRMPRVARRTYPYWGTVGTVLDTLRTLGQATPTVEEGPALVDFVAWEALYRELDLYHPSVYQSDEVMSGRGLYEAMQRGEVDLTTTHSLGVRLLVGNRDEGIWGYLPGDGADLQLSTLPRGVSLALDASGAPARQGSRQGWVDGWVWGIPASAPDPRRSLALLRALTAREAAQRETGAFLIEPVRTDVAWGTSAIAARVAAVTRRQQALDAGALVPRPGSVAEIGRLRARVDALWQRLIVSRGYGAGRIDERAIAARVHEVLAAVPAAPE